MTKSNSNGGNSTRIHISLQGKGGVGKSLVAAILSQYLASRGQDVRGIDADPVNHTLSEYRGIGARCLNILKDGSVDQREFDSLMEGFLTETGTFVVDTGASTFIPLWHYVLENHALEHLRDRGKRVYIHSVITGGQSLSDTLSGFEQLSTCLYRCRHRGVDDRGRGGKRGSREVPGFRQRVLRLQSYTQSQGACDFRQALNFSLWAAPGYCKGSNRFLASHGQPFPYRIVEELPTTWEQSETKDRAAGRDEAASQNPT